MVFAIEIFLTAQCFKDKKEKRSLRFKAFTYCFSGELIKGAYLPFYLTKKTNFSLVSLVRSFDQFLQWEKEKLRVTFNLLFLNKQRRLEYAKI